MYEKIINLKPISITINTLKEVEDLKNKIDLVRILSNDNMKT